MSDQNSTDQNSTDLNSTDEVLSTIKGTHDSLSVKRCYGDPIELDGVTVIPVARVSGGAGGGGGEGTDEHDAGGRGFGTGFGLRVNPIGVYEVRGNLVVWKPTVDVNRLLKGGQVLGGIIAVCVTLVALSRRHCTRPLRTGSLHP
jgi:uncharacterized spore protein YtfJ